MMFCPLCGKDLIVIGDYGNNYSSEIKPPVGWDCPTKNRTACLSWDGNEWFFPKDSHYSVRGEQTNILLYPFRVETWRVSEEHPNTSHVYRHTDDGWVKVWSCPAISLESEDKLLARLKLLLVFS